MWQIFTPSSFSGLAPWHLGEMQHHLNRFESTSCNTSQQLRWIISIHRGGRSEVHCDHWARLVMISSRCCCCCCIFSDDAPTTRSSLLCNWWTRWWKCLRLKQCHVKVGTIWSIHPQVRWCHIHTMSNHLLALHLQYPDLKIKCQRTMIDWGDKGMECGQCR